MSTYTVTFDRVGRRGGRDGSTPPAPLTVHATTPDDLAREVHEYVRPFLGSRDLETMTGGILAGMNNGGGFTIAAAETAGA